MRLIRGGAFWMGCDNFYDDEKPARPARVGDFWMDEIPVTNRQFAEFVRQTGYVTFAEHPPNPADYPSMDPALAHPGSIVFTPPDHAVDLAHGPSWWSFILGADWRHPLGPDSSLDGLWDHPVVHVAYADAAAFAAWARKSLPSEAEWEYAARGGLDRKDYAWGDELEPGGAPQAKTWQGEFPWKNDAPPGLERTAPVRSYPANPFGLHDLIGNVWEWTEDWYAATPPTASPCCGGGSRAVTARESVDPQSGIPRRVTKGGSHLCAPSYCQRYRPAARWAQPIDSTTTHLGFRCIVRR